MVNYKPLNEIVDGAEKLDFLIDADDRTAKITCYKNGKFDIVFSESYQDRFPEKKILRRLKKGFPTGKNISKIYNYISNSDSEAIVRLSVEGSKGKKNYDLAPGKTALKFNLDKAIMSTFTV